MLEALMHCLVDRLLLGIRALFLNCVHQVPPERESILLRLVEPAPVYLARDADWIGARERCALATALTMRDSMVSAPTFVGLENYRKLAGDPVFLASLTNTLVYIAGSTVLITVVSLGLAMAINSQVPGRG